MGELKPLAIIIPAYNEEKVIEQTICSLKGVFEINDIYLVSDGSTDRTIEIAKRHMRNILPLEQNVGKAKALRELIEQFQLTERYRYIYFFDADSRITDEVKIEITKVLHLSPACIVGTVTSNRHKLISAFRVFEYGFSHRLFKRAQNEIGAITVAPGCASIYRSDIIEKLDFENHTLTEDYDFTIQIHRKKLGKIMYLKNFKVLTQDPQTLGDYWRQMSRWYTGGWQNMFLYRLYLPKDKISAEVGLLTIDALIWIATLILFAFKPILLLKIYLYSIVLIGFIALIVILLERQLWAIKYIPFFFVFQLINLVAYVYSFFRAIFGKSYRLSWQKVERY